MNSLESILYYIVKKHNETITTSILGRRRLMNLLFLCDRRAYFNSEAVGRITSLTYLKYKSGPYSKAVFDAVENANEKHYFHGKRDGGTFEYVLCNCPFHEPDVKTSSLCQNIIEQVLREYGERDTSELTSLISNLSEVSSKQKYAPIEFSQDVE